MSKQMFLEKCKQVWDNSRETSAGKKGALDDIKTAPVFEQMLNELKFVTDVLDELAALDVMDQQGNRISYSITKHQYGAKNPRLGVDIHYGGKWGIGIQKNDTGTKEPFVCVFDGSRYPVNDKKLIEKMMLRLAGSTTHDLLNSNLKSLLLE